MTERTDTESIATGSDIPRGRRAAGSRGDGRRGDGRRGGGSRRRLLLPAGVVLVLVVLWTFGGSLRITRRWDTSDVTNLQLNGGTMTLVADDEDYLKANVPLRALPVLMARRSDGLLEAGGFDDSDPRVLLMFLRPFGDAPAPVDAVRWELHTSKLKRVTVAGGTLRSDRYRAEHLELFGAAGRVELEGLDLSTLAVHTQDPADVELSGEAGTYSAMNSGGDLDVSGLHYDRYDEDIIQAIITAE